jgi:hypothetical protein
LAALLVMGVVYSFGTSWPFQDSFGLFDSLERWRATFLLDIARARNGEHLSGFHYLVSLMTLVVAESNFMILMYLSALLWVTSIAVLLQLLRAPDLAGAVRY